METKKCTKCGVEKEATFENFGKGKTSKNGMKAMCKDCHKKEGKKYRQKEGWKEANRKWAKEWSDKNPEKKKEIGKKWYKKNKKNHNKKRREKYVKKTKPPIPTIKKCTQCKIEFPYNASYFVNHNKTRSGLGSECKECNKKRRVKYQSTDMFKVLNNVRTKKWYNNNKEKVQKLNRAHQKRYNEILSDHIVKSSLKRIGLEDQDITPELIETKRLLLFIKRELKKNK